VLRAVEFDDDLHVATATDGAGHALGERIEPCAEPPSTTIPFRTSKRFPGLSGTTTGVSMPAFLRSEAYVAYIDSPFAGACIGNTVLGARLRMMVL